MYGCLWPMTSHWPPMTSHWTLDLLWFFHFQSLFFSLFPENFTPRDAHCFWQWASRKGFKIYKKTSIENLKGHWHQASWANLAENRVRIYKAFSMRTSFICANSYRIIFLLTSYLWLSLVLSGFPNLLSKSMLIAHLVAVLFRYMDILVWLMI